MKLEKDKVQIIEHDPLFEEVFNKEYKRLKNAFKHSEILHVGSSSVPIPSKPIVDIMIAVSIVKETQVKKLESLGYKFIGYVANNGARIFLVLENDPYDIYLHLVRKNGKYYKDTKRFKDILLKNADIRQIYSELKYGLVKASDNRDMYSLHKGSFIDFLLENHDENTVDLEAIRRKKEEVLVDHAYTVRLLGETKIKLNKYSDKIKMKPK